MPKSLRCKIKKLCYNGALTERERDRILKALDYKWIPVSERLPATRDEVLIFLANGQITIASYNDHILPFFDKSIGWGVDPKRFVFYFCSDDVIAWMPLPEPYKGE